jgi:hypothetical protein
MNDSQSQDASPTAKPAAASRIATTQEPILLVPVLESSSRGIGTDHYPVTTALLWTIHLLFIYQWRRRLRLRGNGRHQGHRTTISVSYVTLVQRKQYYQWWVALLSQYDYKNDNEPNTTSTTANIPLPTSFGSDSFWGNGAPLSWFGTLAHWLHDVGLRSSERESTRETTSLHQQPPLARLEHMVRRIVHWQGILPTSLGRRLSSGGGGGYHAPSSSSSSLLLLWYNAHLLWSCRALERHYQATSGTAASLSSSWSYARVLVSVAVAATLLECALSRCLVDWILAHASSMTIITTATTAPDFAMSTTLGNNHTDDELPTRIRLDPTLARRLCESIYRSPLGAPSLTSVSAALLMMFRYHFPHVAVSLVPGLSRWLLGPHLAHGVALLVLHRVSLIRSPHNEPPLPAATWVPPTKAIVVGSLVGMAWGTQWLDFGSCAYWGNGVLIMVILLTVISLKAHQPEALYCAWLDSVGFNTAGQMLVYDTQTNTWLQDEALVDAGSFIKESVSDNENDLEDRRPESDFTDIERADNDHMTELTPLASSHGTQIRSRRGAAL